MKPFGLVVARSAVPTVGSFSGSGAYETLI